MHTRKNGPNHEATWILVMMEANGEFSDEVPIFMKNDEGEKMDEITKVVYWNPPSRCARCMAFGHWSMQCKGLNIDEESKEKEEDEVVNVEVGVGTQTRGSGEDLDKGDNELSMDI